MKYYTNPFGTEDTFEESKEKMVKFAIAAAVVQIAVVCSIAVGFLYLIKHLFF